MNECKASNCDEECVEELAGNLYAAYSEAVGGVAFNGDPLPNWEEFSTDEAKTKQADAWKVVAKTAVCLVKENCTEDEPELTEAEIEEG